MWQMITILYATIGLSLVLFTRARGVISDSIADADIITGSNTSWRVNVFLTIAYSSAVLLWPIFVHSWFANHNATKPSNHYLEKEKTMGLFDLFGKKRNETNGENSKVGDIFGEYLATMKRISHFSPLDVGDQIPHGHGEFGLTPSNPIPLAFNVDEPRYFSLLRTESGKEVTFEVVDVVDSEVVSREIRALLPFTKPIKEIAISANGIKVATLYSLSYFTRDSNKAPRGFKLIPLSAE